MLHLDTSQLQGLSILLFFTLYLKYFTEFQIVLEICRTVPRNFIHCQTEFFLVYPMSLHIFLCIIQVGQFSLIFKGIVNMIKHYTAQRFHKYITIFFNLDNRKLRY